MDAVSTFFVGIVAAGFLWLSLTIFEKKYTKKQTTSTETESNINYED